MATTAKKTNPKLWDKVKAKVTDGDKGGKPGQWSARKAQMATAEYKKEGGGYDGEKTPDNHLTQWTREEWGTRSGETSGETGERYLPKRAREALKPEDYDRSTRKKQADTRKGKQFSAQPRDVAEKTATYRDTGHDESPKAGSLDGMTRRDLMAKAADRNIKGRSRMKKDALIAALS